MNKILEVLTVACVAIAFLALPGCSGNGKPMEDRDRAGSPTEPNPGPEGVPPSGAGPIPAPADGPASPEAAPEPAPEPEALPRVSFETDLFPVFRRSCGACHRREGGNEGAVASGTYYETKEDVLGNVGRFILPGKPEESGLVKILAQEFKVGKSRIVMPPPGAGIRPWSAEEVERFKTWIREGAEDH